jgi:GDSL-like Lipase/Acylhydrolase family
MTGHVVLLGDSILDNASYVPGRRPAVIDQVRTRLPQVWSATLLARDGSVIEHVLRWQLPIIPAGASHLVLSVGGNDVLEQIRILYEPAATVGDALRVLLESRIAFAAVHRRLIQALLERGLPTVVCTVYNPCSDEDEFQRAAVAALCLYNDAIIDNARRFRLPVIDLRAVCSEVADYANEFEPSALGGAKIADAVCQVVTGHDFAARRSVIVP